MWSSTTSSTSCAGGRPDDDPRDTVNEREPRIVELARGNLRYRVLPEEHFAFRGGGVTVLMSAGAASRGCTDAPLAREARLLPEHARIYPCLTPDVWELAAVIAEKVMAWQLQQAKGLRSGNRHQLTMKVPQARAGSARLTRPCSHERERAQRHTLVSPLHECCKSRVLELGRSVEPGS